MSELRYRKGATHDGGVYAFALDENECDIFRGGGDPDGWMLRFCFRRTTDGKLENRAIPIVPNQDAPANGPGWGLKRVSDTAGRWQVSPSIQCLERIADPEHPEDRTKDRQVETWHQTPAIVDVPDGEPWQSERMEEAR